MKTILNKLVPIFIIFMCGMTNVYAFKVQTHVWIGQQVINDVSDGYLTFEVNGQLYNVPVNSNVKEAITNNPSFYRMGNIGPDAVPDIIVGQLVVHPGIENSWATDDWLKYLLNSPNIKPEELAFIYGYLGHASADMWAHTFVNMYSGNVFRLDDGYAEEERHIEIEKFIAKYDPPIMDVSGTSLGKPEDLLAVPDIFLRDRLVLNDEVAKRNREGGATHLAFVQDLYSALEGLGDKELRGLDIIVMKFFVYAYTDEWISDEEAGDLVDVASSVREFVTDNDGSEEAQEAINLFLNTISKYISTASELYNKVVNANQKVEDATFELRNKIEQILNVSQYENYSCKVSCRIATFPIKWGTCDSLCSRLSQEWVDLDNRIKELENNIIPAARQLAKDQTNLAITAMMTDIGIQQAAANGAIDTLERITSDVNAVRALRDGWRKDIEEAMREYMHANTELIRRSMDYSNKTPELLEPLTEWWDCYGSSMVGIPQPITKAGCTVNKYIEDLNSALNKVMTSIDNLGAAADPTGVLEKVNETKAKINTEIKDFGINLAIEIAEKLFKCKFSEILDAYSAEPTEARLHSLFSQDRSGAQTECMGGGKNKKGLVTISDMPSRMKAEMNLNGNQFDPDKFNVINNAITMVKLSLLDAKGINDLVSQVMNTTTTLYTENNFDTSNILFGMLKNMDGNHQWMRLAPPYAREAGYKDELWPQERSYGYSNGVPLWSNCAARNQVFRQLFKGPVAQGFEQPGLIGFNKVAPNNLPMLGTAAEPLPDGYWNMQCEWGGVFSGIINMILQ